MQKKWLRFIGLTLAIVALILGCQSLLISSSPTAQPVVITMSGWGASPDEEKLLKQVLTNFERSHPQTRVKFEAIADQYMDVIKTRLIGEAAPDVFYLEAVEAPLLMAREVLEPLDAYVTPEFDLADFEENLLNLFRYNGQLYGFPKDFSTLALFYNQQAFAAAGLSRPPKTWAELVDYSKKLTVDRNQDNRPEQYGLGILPELARQAYIIKAFGGQIIDSQGRAAFAAPNSLKGLEQVVEQYRVDRTSALPADVGANAGNEMFGQGRVAMAIEGNWMIPFLQETFPGLQFATAEVPTLNDRPGTMAFTVAYVMNRQCQHKQEAWELIAYLTGKEGMEQWTRLGFALSTRKSVAARLRYDEEPLRSPLITGVKYATPWQLGQYPAAISNNFNNQFISAMIGEQPLPQAMQRAQAAANQQILTMQ